MSLATAERTPGLRPMAIVCVAAALSIGWGIRGNYGHEIGAMFPGALAALAACLVSGRADWQARWPYFALWGGLGWGFGGSISYMQVIAYTHSGSGPSQLYGFAGLFLIGFLWASLGGAGTALVATLDRRRLTELFRPLLWVLAILTLLHVVLPELLTRVQKLEGAMRRQDSALYWFDGDWLSAVVLLCGLLVYDLADRRGRGLGDLLVCILAGTGAGAVLGWVLRATGLGAVIWPWLVRPQGDVSLFPAEKLPINWPNFVPQIPEHLGWMMGLMVGIGVHFARRGQFRNGSRLFVWMCAGWLASFLIFPTLLGMRLTPPRGDDWAGILGVMLALLWWCYAERLPAVAWSALACGTLGGCAFSGAAWLKMAMMSLGHPALAGPEGISDAWRHYQSANWHSFLEQTYGWGNGVGVAITLGLLSRWLPQLDNQAPRQRWTELVSIVLALPGLVYLNQVQNLDDWTVERAGYRALPLEMTAPWFSAWKMSSTGWFSCCFAVATVGFVWVLLAHLRQPLAICPPTRTGRGQLALVLLLWAMVLGNFAKSLSGFHEQRLLTEGVITLHAVLLTCVALTLRTPRIEPPVAGADWSARLRNTTALLVVAWILLPVVFTFTIRGRYGSHPAGHAGLLYRFGPEAAWRTQPVLRGETHR